MTSAENTISAIVARELDLPRKQVTPESTLGSLGADSLECVSILMAIENELGIDIVDAGFDRLTTVSQLATTIR